MSTDDAAALTAAPAAAPAAASAAAGAAVGAAVDAAVVDAAVVDAASGRALVGEPTEEEALHDTRLKRQKVVEWKDSYKKDKLKEYLVEGMTKGNDEPDKAGRVAMSKFQHALTELGLSKDSPAQFSQLHGKLYRWEACYVLNGDNLPGDSPNMASFFDKGGKMFLHLRYVMKMCVVTLEYCILTLSPYVTGRTRKVRMVTGWSGSIWPSPRSTRMQDLVCSQQESSAREL